MRPRKWPIPFLDLSNTLFFFFVALFAITLIVITDTTSAQKIDTTSKLLINMKWQDGSPDDVDLSVMTPNQDVVWYRTKQFDFTSLDHDNLGSSNNTVTDADGNVITSNLRDEVVFIRQTIPGTYIVNVHLYTKHSGRDVIDPVTINLIGVDPSYKLLYSRQIDLFENKEEHTAFRFTIDSLGYITSIDTIEELFINEMLGKP